MKFSDIFNWVIISCIRLNRLLFFASKMRIYILFSTLIIYQTTQILCEGTLVIGLFSIVDQTSSKAGGENFTAAEQKELKNYTHDWFIKKGYRFQSHDVGESTLELSKIVVELMTNREYFNEDIFNESMDSKIAAFIVHVTPKLLNRLQMFLQGSEIPIFSLSSEHDFKLAEYNVYYHFLYWMRGFDDLLNMKQNAYGEVIFLKEKQPKDHEEFHKDFKDLLRRLRKLKMSYRLYRYKLDVNATSKNIELKEKVEQLAANITQILNSSRCICNRRLILLSNRDDMFVIRPALLKHDQAFDARVGIRWFYPNYDNETDSIFLRHYIHSIFTEIHNEYLGNEEFYCVSQ